MEEELVHDEVGGGEGEGGEDEGPPAAQEVGEQAAWGTSLEGEHGGRWVGGVKDRRWEGTPSNTYQAAEDIQQRMPRPIHYRKRLETPNTLHL